MRRSNALIFIWLLFLLGACEPIEIEPYTSVGDEPVFEVGGTMDDLGFKIQAGVDNYNMVTNSITSESDLFSIWDVYCPCPIEGSNVNYYSSSFTKNSNCASGLCKEKFEFLFYSDENVNNINDLFDPKHLTEFEYVPEIYNYKIFNKSSEGINLFITDGDTLDVLVEDGGYEVDFEQPTFPVFYKYEKEDEYSIEILNFNGIESEWACDLIVNLDYVGGNCVNVSFSSNVDTEFDFMVNGEYTNQIEICTMGETDYVFSIITQEGYCEYSVQIHFYENIILENLHDEIASSLEYKIVVNVPQDELFVVMFYTDEDGVEFRGYVNYFELINTESYTEKNEFGQNLLKVDVKFDVIFIPIINNTPPIEPVYVNDGMATIAIAYE